MMCKVLLLNCSNVSVMIHYTGNWATVCHQTSIDYTSTNIVKHVRICVSVLTHLATETNQRWLQLLEAKQ